MIVENILKVGDASDNGQVTIVDEDRLCYLVRSESRGAVGLRTISKALLNEYVAFFSENPDATPTDARDFLSGKSDVDRYEYGYTSTLSTMAKMVIANSGQTPATTGNRRKVPNVLQQIFYGAPGTGKSNTIKRNVDNENKICFRTTFHPDSDYATFVGAYKPSMKPTGAALSSGEKEEIITYKFVPQAFTKAYAAAWNTTEDVFLVIEEINRDNCAQIFGDLFQLLDRKGGKSEYPIEADTDLANYLQEALANSPRTDMPQEIKNGKRLMLPQNLYIWATMNTSDQSLFPIDSAFKRRWDWVYIPIKPHAEENYKIKIGNETYDWWGFLQKINSVIDDTTHSEDKKLGYFFVNTESKTVCAEKFVSKVLFYLWNDVFKNYGFDHSIFTDNLGVKFTFSDFFNEDGTPNTNRVNDFLKKLDNEIDKEHSFIEITSTETKNQGLPNTNE